MTLHRFRWRIASVVTATMLATALLVYAAPATLAVGPGSMQSTSYGWRDPDCGTSAATFELRLYRDTQFGGTQWRFCSDFPNLCFAPYGNDSSAATLCVAGYDGSTANDYGSSLKVVSIQGGSSCRVEVREDANYQGGRVVWWDPENVPTLVPWPSDVISSLRRVCG